MRLDPHRLRIEIYRAFLEHINEIVRPNVSWNQMRAAEIAADTAIRLALTPIRPPDPAPAPAPPGPVTHVALTPEQANQHAHRERLETEIREWTILLIADPDARDIWIDGYLHDTNQARHLKAGELARVSQARTIADLTLAELEHLHSTVLTLAEGVTT